MHSSKTILAVAAAFLAQVNAQSEPVICNGQLYPADQGYICYGTVACPAAHLLCGTLACYLPSQYSCVNGMLVYGGGTDVTTVSGTNTIAGGFTSVIGAPGGGAGGSGGSTGATAATTAGAGGASVASSGPTAASGGSDSAATAAAAAAAAANAASGSSRASGASGAQATGAPYTPEQFARIQSQYGAIGMSVSPEQLSSILAAPSLPLATLTSESATASGTTAAILQTLIPEIAAIAAVVGAGGASGASGAQAASAPYSPEQFARIQSQYGAIGMSVSPEQLSSILAAPSLPLATLTSESATASGVTASVLQTLIPEIAAIAAVVGAGGASGVSGASGASGAQATGAPYTPEQFARIQSQYGAIGMSVSPAQLSSILASPSMPLADLRSESATASGATAAVLQTLIPEIAAIAAVVGAGAAAAAGAQATGASAAASASGRGYTPEQFARIQSQYGQIGMSVSPEQLSSILASPSLPLETLTSESATASGVTASVLQTLIPEIAAIAAVVAAGAVAAAGAQSTGASAAASASGRGYTPEQFARIQSQYGQIGMSVSPEQLSSILASPSMPLETLTSESTTASGVTASVLQTLIPEIAAIGVAAGAIGAGALGVLGGLGGASSGSGRASGSSGSSATAAPYSPSDFARIQSQYGLIGKSVSPAQLSAILASPSGAIATLSSEGRSASGVSASVISTLIPALQIIQSSEAAAAAGGTGGSGGSGTSTSTTATVTAGGAAGAAGAGGAGSSASSSTRSSANNLKDSQSSGLIVLVMSAAFCLLGSFVL